MTRAWTFAPKRADLSAPTKEARMPLAATSRSSSLDLASPAGVPQASRRGALDGPPSGRAPGFVRGNLAILPAGLAADFLRCCHKNPKPCPLIGGSEVG